jgi:hypothetical protein
MTSPPRVIAEVTQELVQELFQTHDYGTLTSLRFSGRLNSAELISYGFFTQKDPLRLIPRRIDLPWLMMTFFLTPQDRNREVIGFLLGYCRWYNYHFNDNLTIPNLTGQEIDPGIWLEEILACEVTEPPIMAMNRLLILGVPLPPDHEVTNHKTAHRVILFAALEDPSLLKRLMTLTPGATLNNITKNDLERVIGSYYKESNLDCLLQVGVPRELFNRLTVFIDYINKGLVLAEWWVREGLRVAVSSYRLRDFDPKIHSVDSYIECVTYLMRDLKGSSYVDYHHLIWSVELIRQSIILGYKSTDSWLKIQSAIRTRDIFRRNITRALESLPRRSKKAFKLDCEAPNLTGNQTDSG